MALRRPDPETTPVLDHWSPANSDERARLLSALARGDLRLSRSALDEIETEGAAGIHQNLQIDVAGAVSLAISDRDLYMAASRWHREARRALFAAMRQYPLLADRILGYGMYLLTGAEGDPLPAWRPMGDWIFHTAAGWQRFRQSLVLPRRHARDLAELERRSPPWARRFQVLSWLAVELERGDFKDLLHLAGRHGRLFTRIRARGAVDDVDRRLAAARARQQEAVAAAGPDYPDLIPTDQFHDVESITVRPESEAGASGTPDARDD